MRMRRFLTAKKLGITPNVHEALHATRELFATGKIVYVPMNTSRRYGFNMADWDWGETHCMMGWARKLCKGSFYSTGSLPPGLMKLCYPSFGGAPAEAHMTQITVAQAVVALTNYLCTGNPDWASVVSVDAPVQSQIVVVEDKVYEMA